MSRFGTHLWVERFQVGKPYCAVRDRTIPYSPVYKTNPNLCLVSGPIEILASCIHVQDAPQFWCSIVKQNSTSCTLVERVEFLVDPRPVPFSCAVWS